MKNILYILTILLIATSCEKVITIDLGNNETQLVIDATLMAPEGDCSIKISTSSDFYMEKPYTYKDNAIITITNLKSDEVTNIPIKDKSKGVYYAKVNIEYSSNYKLEVKLDGQTYTATSFLQEKTSVDSIKIKEKVRFSTTPRLIPTIYFQDPKDIANYYRTKIYVNGETDQSNFQRFDDNLRDGEKIIMEIDPKTRKRGGDHDNGDDDDLQSGDTVRIDLLSLDKTTYDYYKMLSKVHTGAGREPEVPANPTNNFDGDVLGYFGVLSKSTIETIVK